MSSKAGPDTRDRLRTGHQYRCIGFRFGVALCSECIPAGITLAVCIETADHLIQQTVTVRCGQLKNLLDQEFYWSGHRVTSCSGKRGQTLLSQSKGGKGFSYSLNV